MVFWSFGDEFCKTNDHDHVYNCNWRIYFFGGLKKIVIDIQHCVKWLFSEEEEISSPRGKNTTWRTIWTRIEDLHVNVSKQIPTYIGFLVSWGFLKNPYPQNKHGE